MNLTTIQTLDDLKYYLANALQLEHATIPPYLTAMYSIKPGTNSDASHVIRVVAVEEMLHMTLVANMLNAIGGTPDLTGADFVPDYPTYLPDGEQNFKVCVQRFSEEAIDNFLQIEQPAAPKPSQDRETKRPETALLQVSKDLPRLQFSSIGEFYAEIGRGFEALHAQLGDKLFVGDVKRQVTAGYFYSGGGGVIPIVDIESTRNAVRLISDQGEGYAGGIFDHKDELAHYFRFQQLKLGKYYLKGDKPDHPTGPDLHVDFDAAYPIKTDACFTDYPEGSELYAAALAFANEYKEFLAMITAAFNGHPEKLQEAVPWMFRLKEKATAIIRNPIPGMDGLNGTPIFSLPKKGGTKA